MAQPYFILFVVFLYSVLELANSAHAAGKELFAFPADEVISAYLENARNRTPVYIPGKCSTNEILYPGDHDNDWVCDCRPGHVYYPQNDACFALFTQGFCQVGEYVDLERPSMLVKCTKNTCSEKDKLPFRGLCVELNRNNQICPLLKHKPLVIGVNVTTLELDCIEGSPVPLQTRFELEPIKDATTSAFILFEGANRCTIGTKTVYNGLCA